MPLDLVPRSARIFSAHLNRYYRVLKGIDPESVSVRLLSGGVFQIRNSVTNAPVFTVTDTGISGSIGGGSIVPGTVDTAQLADGAVNSAKILDGTIVDADVNTTAAIAVTKLAHVGANNVLRSGGTANVGGQVVNGDLAAKTIRGGLDVGNGRIADGSLVNGDLAAKTIRGGLDVGNGRIADGSLVNGDLALKTIRGGVDGVNGRIADATIVNADLSATAGVVVSKLAAGVTANRVVATADGSTVAMQQVVGAMIADGTITSVKLAGGIPVPAGSITTNEIADGTILNADINASAGIAGSKLAAHAATFLHGGAITGGSTGTPTSYASISDQTFTTISDQLLCFLAIEIHHGTTAALVDISVQIDNVSIYTLPFNQMTAGYQMAATLVLPLVGIYPPGSHRFNFLAHSNTGGTVTWSQGYWAILELFR